jgi:lipopolysaccharide/colanic/teichoic acid biosynthesis glycosyltransferase
MTPRGCESASTRHCHAQVVMQRTVLIAVSVTDITVITLYLLLVAIVFHFRFISSEI